VTLQIDCIDNNEAVGHLAPEWLQLWRACNATPFQSPHWLLAWWGCFGTGVPQIITAREDGALVGVLPLYTRREPDRVKLLPFGIGLSDYLDILVPPGRGDAADALLGAIAELPDWQECHLPDLPPGAVLLAAASPSDCGEERAATVPCPVLVLPGSTEELGTVVPRKALRDLHQGQRRCAAAGAVTIERADADTLDAAIDDLFSLHQKRWQRRGETGVCGETEVQRFHRQAARAMLGAGLLRLYRLWIGDAVAAVYYGFIHRRHAYAYLAGFDPELPRHSPGAQVLAHAIGEAIAEGAVEFHFLRGGESYKYAWGAADRWNTARTFRR
jgi:CelD/BcsL family acetyltransferase involved in cellulose biosynthesis